MSHDDISQLDFGNARETNDDIITRCPLLPDPIIPNGAAHLRIQNNKERRKRESGRQSYPK
jgi:hypothetical protein